jgi:hypothetical protein
VLYADGALVVALVCLWVYCLLDVLTTRGSAMRNLPKAGWFVVVLLGGFGVGPLLWLLLGRPRGAARQLAAPAPAAPPARPTAPDDDEEFLRGLRARAEEQRRRAAEQRAAEDDQRP